MDQEKLTFFILTFIIFSIPFNAIHKSLTRISSIGEMIRYRELKALVVGKASNTFER